MALTPIKAIRAKCLECSCGQQKEIRLCTIKSCSLYPYRMGHRPKADTLDNETAAGEINAASMGILEQEG